jgi:hypothetical protein
VRNALIVLAAVALVLVGIGGLNHSLRFDVDFVVVSWSYVSVFWITLVVGAALLLTGLVAAFLARTSAVAAQRKLEAELQTTYERLRAAEARIPAEPPAPTEEEEPPVASLVDSVATDPEAPPTTD